MKIAIRMDDITPDMDWEKFRKFKALMDEYQVKPLIGVVPDNQDENLNREKDRAENQASQEENFWQYIRDLQKGGWIVALHGYKHLYTQRKGGSFPLNRFSEFAGLELEKQKEMLAAGREIFFAQGIETDIFMAPAHSYDSNTLRALKELGFTKITDGFGSRPYHWKGITFYPISFRLGSSLKRKQGVTTMVIHTNTMSDEDMKRCSEIFRKAEIISYGEYLQMTPVKRGMIGRGLEYLLASLKRVLVKFL